MAEWTQLEAEINEFVEGTKRNIDDFQADMKAKIEAAKQDELLKTLQAVNKRLDAIEKRLPPEEETAPSVRPRT